jgi:hypothetical protein
MPPTWLARSVSSLGYPLVSDYLSGATSSFWSIPFVGSPPCLTTQQKASLLPHFLQRCVITFLKANQKTDRMKSMSISNPTQLWEMINNFALFTTGVHSALAGEVLSKGPRNCC